MAVHKCLAAVTREGEWFVARCLDVDVESRGRTLEEALSTLRAHLAQRLAQATLAKIPVTMVVPLEVDLPESDSTWPLSSAAVAVQ